MNFKGKKVFITGVTRGIGKEISKKFYEHGAQVYGTGTAIARFDEGELFQADFSKIDQIKLCAKYVENLAPDIVINNAGINKNESFVNIDPEIFLEIQQINVFAPLLIMQASLPGMLCAGWGRIVNISSIWGKISMEGRAAYSASKFALDGLTLGLAAEYASSGVLANCIAPGFTDTELTQKMLGPIGIQKILEKVPMKRMATVSEIAELVLWLSSEKNTYITGQNIAIDGGFYRA
jgi:3-oxoacyl-[acyl-carrier protein] reductase